MGDVPWASRGVSLPGSQPSPDYLAEDEAAYEATTHTAMDVPVELVLAVRELIAKRRPG